MNEVLNAIKTRRSVRSYTDRQLSQEDLDQIIEAGTYAPTAHNEQAWHFTVIQNKEFIDHIVSVSNAIMATSENEWVRSMGSNPKFRVTYEAPTVIIVSAKKDAMGFAEDCSAAIQNMMLAAHSLGICSVWIGLLRFYLSVEEEVKKLNLPEGYVPFHGVAFGYNGNKEMPPIPVRKTDVVNYIR
jgi:nitroreductase